MLVLPWVEAGRAPHTGLGAHAPSETGGGGGGRGEASGPGAAVGWGCSRTGPGRQNPHTSPSNGNKNEEVLSQPLLVPFGGVSVPPTAPVIGCLGPSLCTISGCLLCVRE